MTDVTDERPASAPAGRPGEPSDDLPVGPAPSPTGRAAGTGPTGGPELRTILEALLLVADEPVTERVLAEVAGATRTSVGALLSVLADEYDEQHRGFDLREVAGGWRLYTRPECAEVVERYVLRGQQARMTQAALETLAVVAYRQPVSRGRVAAVRGVNVDGVIRTLVSRGLIEEQGTDEDTGALRYGTTALFLERLGLTSLSGLPPLAPLLPELESLSLDDDSILG